MDNTYWNGSGKYQELTDDIEKLIPRQGAAGTPELDLFRISSNAYYDLYNNGGCNISRFKACAAVCKTFEPQLMANGVNAVDLITIELVAGADDGGEGFYSPDFTPEVFEAFERLSDAAVLIVKASL